MESKFLGYVNNLGTALGLNENEINKLKSFLEQFSDTDKFKLVNNTDETVKKLVTIDQKISSLVSGELKPYMASIRDSWNQMNLNLAELQVLSLIQRKENCDELINELLRFLTIKVSNVNEIVKTNLLKKSSDTPAKKSDKELLSKVVSQTSTTAALNPVKQPTQNIQSVSTNQSTNSKYLMKYLKYKNKYLSLKKNFNY